MTSPLSIIMPVFNEAPTLEASLQALQPLRELGHELIVVDGGSRDNTLSLARRYADRVVMSGAGRAQQMNAGAEYAKHEIYLFLHADTRLPDTADVLIHAALQPVSSRWGRFDIRLDSKNPVYRLIESSINVRSAISGIATGDQAIFVERKYFELVGTYDAIGLMEDVALSKKLLHFAWPARIKHPVITSARKWQRDGIIKTIGLMWTLRTAYFFGANPDRLVDFYYPSEKGTERG